LKKYLTKCLKMFTKFFVTSKPLDDDPFWH
jgi:hypothetical protein